MPSSNDQRASFFPKADAAVLQSKYTPPSPSSRPTEIAPILDVENANRAIDCWSADLATAVYPKNSDHYVPAIIPEKPQCGTDKYLFPMLTRNERLRLTMLFYYTRGALDDRELVSRLQEKVHLAGETVGWELVIAGLLDHNTFTRVVTIGLPLAVLPRRESPCSHTVNQPPGTIFTLNDMMKDWRFRESPHVDQGGLRAYAGVPLRFETEFGEHVAFGSLCVASYTAQEPLSRSQQMSLVRLADWIVADIIHSARARRQRERRHMQELLSSAQKWCDQSQNLEDAVIAMLREVYPETVIDIQTLNNGRIVFEGCAVVSVSKLENGLWEDCDRFNDLIENFNHQDPVAAQVVRVIAAECENASSPTFLVVGSKDFRLVFDDVDSWFVHMCASLLSRGWQNRALKEALTAKENFLRGITHQLRTPIHGILGSVELLAEELKSRKLIIDAPVKTPSPPMTPDVEHLDPYLYIKTIRNSANELIMTVNSMIKLNRWTEIAQAERTAALHRIAEIETLVLNETLLMMPDNSHARPAIIFNNHLPERCDSAILDMRLLLDCIIPLVVNAVQNTATGVVAITASVAEDLQSLTIDVEDNGCGICQSDQGRIFQAYEKVDTHTTGAGLGLTLASRLASLMSGSISLVSSEVGKGSHFRATFSDVAFACSFQRSQELRGKLAHLPPTFHQVKLGARETILGNCFSNYLTNSGFTECDAREGSLLVLDYSSDLVQLHTQVMQVGSQQAAICLVPESGCVINFSGERILRENNVVYVQGPFVSEVLEKALAEADRNYAEFDLAKAEALPSSMCAEHTPTVSLPDLSLEKILEDPSTAVDKVELPPDLVHRSSIFPQSAQKDVLVDSIQTLCINTPPPSSPRPSKRSSKPMTLLVDDNTINLRLLEMYCGRRGLPYSTAIDGQRAIVTFSRNRNLTESTECPSSPPSSAAPFELILMDLQMPLCDGIAATHQIRTMERENGWNRSVILIVTGQDSPSDRFNAEQAGADGFLVKPVGPKVLDAKIRNWFPDLGAT